MTAMPPLRDILNDTEADAVDVDYNFGLIEAHIAQELINRDGSVAMTGPLTTQPPTAPAHAATKAYVDNNIPVGSITMFAGGPGAVPPAPQTVPAGWALCDGSLKGTTDPLYAALFAVIGYTYGGTGGNFNLPNLQSRFPVGRSTVGDASFDGLGETGGNRNASPIAHTHSLSGHSHTVTITATDTNHVHSMLSHQHTMDHDHGSFSTSGDGDHAHAYPVQENNTAGAFGAQGGNNTGTTRNQATISTPGSGGHVHTIDVPNFGGWTGYPNFPNTDWMAQNTSHSHPASAGGPNVDSTGAATGAIDGTNANLPPYITINFIIRIG